MPSYWIVSSTFHASKSLLCRPVLGKARRLYRCLSSSEHNAVKPYYITTPIFYPNSAPHIGHLYTLVTTDIFARYARLTSPSTPVHFLTGTDEHGLKIQKAARDNGLEPGAFCDMLSEKFRSLAKKANISHTRFIRTTERAHHEAVEHVWRELDAKGFIYKDHYEGWYSVSDETFYPTAQITPAASPSALPTSIETGSTVEWSQEENYKFRLSAFRDSLLAHYTSPENANIIRPVQHHKHIVDMLATAPLEDLSVSRPRERLDWGVRVPGDPDQTIYVWFDALTVYLTGCGYPWGESEGNISTGGWPADMQVIGKDILRFHAIYFPAMLQALGLPLPRTLLSHAHWTIQQKKMSKSVGNVADPIEAMDIYNVDIVRYYLARVGGRFKDDVDWSPEQLQKHSDEIQSLLGNFYLRVTSKAIHALVSHSTHKPASDIYAASQRGDPNKSVLTLTKQLPGVVSAAFEARDLAEALAAIVVCLKEANAAMTLIAPWSQPPNAAQASYATSLEVLRVCGICLQPFIPATAAKLLDSLDVPKEKRTWEDAQGWRGVGTVVKGVRLFDTRSIKEGRS